MAEQCAEMMRTMGSLMNGMMGGMMNGMMGGMMNGMMGGMMWPMMVGMLLLWTLLIVGVVLLVRLMWRRGQGRTGSPLRLLQDRYARGEIDGEEYQERSSVLQHRT